MVDKSYNTQLMMDSLGHIVTHWFVVKLSICIKASSETKKNFSQKNSAHPQKMVSLCFQIL